MCFSFRMLCNYLTGLQFQFAPLANIADWRLAVVYYVFLFVVFVYTFGSIIFLHQYCNFTQATVATAPWFTSTRLAPNMKSVPSYCNNPAYDWLLTDRDIASVGNFTMRNISCGWLSDAIVLQFSTSSMAITTNAL